MDSIKYLEWYLDKAGNKQFISEAIRTQKERDLLEHDEMEFQSKHLETNNFDGKFQHFVTLRHNNLNTLYESQIEFNGGHVAMACFEDITTIYLDNF